MSEYQRKNSIAKRIEEYRRVVKKFPTRIPVIIEPLSPRKGASTLLDKSKFLIDGDMAVSQLIWVLKRRIGMDSKSALFLLFNNRFYPNSVLVRDIWNRERDADDNFLYATYMMENTFG